MQAKRKEMNLDMESKIELSVWVEGLELANDEWEHVKSETRAGNASLNEGDVHNDAENFKVDGTSVMFYLS